MEHLTDFETRVLGVLEQRSGLDVEQLASAGRLPVVATTQALKSLRRRELVMAEDSGSGLTYRLNRRNVQKLIAA